jgi:hypothetical protein
LGRFNSNALVDGATCALLASEMLFCCLDGDVPEERLDLFEFTARCVAKACARPPKITSSTSNTPPNHTASFLNFSHRATT